MGQQLGFGFEQMEEEKRTAHIPSIIEEAIPFYKQLIEKHHAAMLAADVSAVQAIRKEAQDLAIKLNGGELCGIDGGEGSPVDLLEKATDAPVGQVPLWGQRGRYTVKVGAMPIEIEQDGIFGIGCGMSFWLGFRAHAVEPDKAFLSETGYRSFLGVHGDATPGMTPDRIATEVCSTFIAKDCKGKTRKIEQRYADRIREERSQSTERQL
jgi:hypothetical protein